MLVREWRASKGGCLYSVMVISYALGTYLCHYYLVSPIEARLEREERDGEDNEGLN